jgi:hypothetical protein
MRKQLANDYATMRELILPHVSFTMLGSAAASLP